MPREYKDILYETHEHVARMTINRLTQYDALTGDTIKKLTLAFEEANVDDEVGVVVLTGAGDKACCAGGDVNWEKEGGLERQVLEPYMRHVTVSRCSKPVIARVNGYAIGGGNHLAYFCDFTIAADHAVFGQNDVLGQGDAVRRLTITPDFWKEEQQEGARALLEKRKPDFSRFRRRKA